MKYLTLPNVLLVSSTFCMLLALGFSAGSLSKSVKWNLYNSGTNFNVNGGQIYKIYAYQNLWTSFDSYKDPQDFVYAQAYELIKKDSWRVLPRLLILATAGIGSFSMSVLLGANLVAFVPFIKNKELALNSCRVVSTVLSITAGCLLAYTLNYYKTKYVEMLAPAFYDPGSNYPDEDNLSTGFYMSGCACVLFFISALLNIVNVGISIKMGISAIKPELA